MRNKRFEQEAEDRKNENRQKRLRKMDADIRGAKFDADNSGSSLLQAANAQKQAILDGLKASNALDIFMGTLKIEKLPTGFITATYDRADAPAVIINGGHHPVDLALQQLSTFRIAKARGSQTLRAIFEPHKLIECLEENGFVLSGPLAEKREEIMAATQKREGPAR